MKDIKYYQDKCERLEKVVTMRECQLRCACDGLISVVDKLDAMGLDYSVCINTLFAVDAIYDLHHGEKIENGFLGEPHKRG